MAGEVKPEKSLAAVCPSVAATWHPERNGERTLGNTSSGMSYRAWWRCPAGHEWDEIVTTRTSMPGWKCGDMATCRIRTGHHIIVTFDCGRTAEAAWQYAGPSAAARRAAKPAGQLGRLSTSSAGRTAQRPRRL